MREEFRPPVSTTVSFKKKSNISRLTEKVTHKSKGPNPPVPSLSLWIEDVRTELERRHLLMFD